MRRMVLVVELIGVRGIRATVAAPVVGPLGLVCGIIGVSEFVIARFRNAPSRDAKPAPEADPLALAAARQVLVKELVVADFVGRDVLADFLQYRLLHGVTQRRVIGAGADFDHAARNHLARARAAA